LPIFKINVLLNPAKVLCLSLLVCFPLLVAAQATVSRAELERSKQELQRQLDQANRELLETKKNKRITLDQLRLLQNKITLRNRLIDNISQDIGLINSDINSAYRDISMEKRDLDILKLQYAKMVVYSYKTRSAYEFVNFILSANSFNDAIRRYEYLKQYRAFRMNQASSILQTEGLLKIKIRNLNETRLGRATVLTSQQKEKQKLEEEKQEKNEVMNNLKGHEKELMTDIRGKQTAQKKLSSTLSILIRREIEDAKRDEAAAAKKPAVVNNAGATPAPSRSGDRSAAAETGSSKTVRPVNPLESTPEALALSKNFEANRGKLPWPVESGYISDPFGPHQHPLLEKVQVDNYGVNISTAAGGVVRAVFDGEVVTATNDAYTKWTVLIRHGEYFTVYSNLSRVSVRKGQQVSTKQAIGTAFTNQDSGETYVHFLVMKNGTFLNPATWLMSR
jgi:septal ring factor EnvC (AmiA/AmiB activator)